MENEIIDIKVAREKHTGKRARISASLRNLSRQCRREILNSHGYHAYWLGEISKEQYARLLHIHYHLRKSIEELFDSLDGTFAVVNLFTDEQKFFVVKKYVTDKRLKSSLLHDDIIDLMGTNDWNEPLPAKCQELIDYMQRVKKVYSVALLGVLYMLEETVTYAGPRIANVLDNRLALKGKATRYLRGNIDQKNDLWEFRRALDLITDFQTQANIVVASTITYRMYRDLLDPLASRTPRKSGIFH